MKNFLKFLLRCLSSVLAYGSLLLAIFLLGAVVFIIVAYFYYKFELNLSSDEKMFLESLRKANSKKEKIVSIENLLGNKWNAICVGYSYGGFSFEKISDYKNYDDIPDLDGDGACAIALIDDKSKTINFYRLKYPYCPSKDVGFENNNLPYGRCALRENKFKIILDNKMELIN